MEMQTADGQQACVQKTLMSDGANKTDCDIKNRKRTAGGNTVHPGRMK